MIGIDTKLDSLLKQSLQEDIGRGDVTSKTIPSDVQSKADIIFKQPGVLCGLPVVERIFRLIDEDLRFLPVAKDGEWIDVSRAVCYAEGRTRSILAAERTALNFLAHMSAVATQTKAFVDKVKGTRAKIYDTRKTTPLFRVLDRYAVKTGGGVNHRFGLYDGALIKDNHLIALSKMSLEHVLHEVNKKVSKNISVGIEVKNLNELQSVIKTTCDYILLDNFSTDDVKRAVEIRNNSDLAIALEVSGGVNISNVLQYAETGVERISVGALTHSVKAVDVSLNLL